MKAGYNFPAQADSAQSSSLERFSQVLKSLLQKSVIEMCVVSDKYPALGKCLDLLRHFTEFRSVLQHFIGNACQPCDEIGNISVGANKCRESVCDFFAIEV